MQIFQSSNSEHLCLRGQHMFKRLAMFTMLHHVLEKQHALINMKHEVKWDGG